LPGSYNNPPPARSRKLLLHGHEIRKLIGVTSRKGLTIVPLELYFKDGIAKVAIALAKAKKLHDKREDLKRRAEERELARHMRTRRGETIVPIATERGSSAVAAPLLARPLGLSAALEGSRATVALGGAIFVFQLGAPFVRAGGVVYGLVGEPYVARDTLFLPLHWLADCVPRAVGGRYRWEPAPGGDTGRLVELPIASAVIATPPPTPPTRSTAPVLPPSPASAPNPITGL